MLQKKRHCSVCNNSNKSFPSAYFFPLSYCRAVFPSVPQGAKMALVLKLTLERTLSLREFWTGIPGVSLPGFGYVRKLGAFAPPTPTAISTTQKKGEQLSLLKKKKKIKRLSVARYRFINMSNLSSDWPLGTCMWEHMLHALNNHATVVYAYLRALAGWRMWGWIRLRVWILPIRYWHTAAPHHNHFGQGRSPRQAASGATQQEAGYRSKRHRRQRGRNRAWRVPR